LADDATDRTKAVACFDLGEFARFFPNGKQVLDSHNLKSKMTMLMQSKSVSSEVKKEAITCY
jgi:V-type H+-transporting ATPase subunit H